MKFVDLFCGAGLGARGAVAAGAQPVFAVDAWDIAADTYAANFPEAEVICGKVEDVCPTEVLEIEENIDVLLTSPECTSHSIARGNRPSCKKSKDTAISIIPWVETLEPRWVIVENVARMRKWERHQELKDDLENLGYTVSELLINAADFGAPQARKRLFLLCDKEGSTTTIESLGRYRVRRKRPASEILDIEGTWKSQPLYKKGRAPATIERAERAITALGENVPFLVVYYGSDYAGGWQSLNAPLRTVTTIDRFGLVTWADGTAMLRMLQPSELIRAMSGDLGHSLPEGSRREKVKLCGNGVCSPALRAIFLRMMALSPETQQVGLINNRL